MKTVGTRPAATEATPSARPAEIDGVTIPHLRLDLLFASKGGQGGAALLRLKELKRRRAVPGRA